MVKKKTDIEMVERMTRLETDVTYIKKIIDSTNAKFDKFVDAVDKKYADKDIETTVKDNTKAINHINITIAKWVGGAVTISTLLTWIIGIIL